ncbi:cell division ATP-binding protein FtsE, partial [Microbacterium sp. zg.Y909]|nr:cell division ATP-binding protein FtsE [Microbacterium sp. zg.Y909]
LARINAGGTTVLMATHEAGFVDQMQRRVIELSGGVIVRDERHGGYGDTSAIPSLMPVEEKGAAAVAALTAVLELQREIIGTSAADIAASAPGSTVHVTAVTQAVASVTPPAASAQPARAGEAAFQVSEKAPPRAAPDAEPAASALPATADEQAAPAEPAPRTNPVTIEVPPVELDELGLADRLGLGGRSAEDEVGPTS